MNTSPTCIVLRRGTKHLNVRRYPREDPPRDLDGATKGMYEALGVRVVPRTVIDALSALRTDEARKWLAHFATMSITHGGPFFEVFRDRGAEWTYVRADLLEQYVESFWTRKQLEMLRRWDPSCDSVEDPPAWALRHFATFFLEEAEHYGRRRRHDVALAAARHAVSFANCDLVRIEAYIVDNVTTAVESARKAGRDVDAEATETRQRLACHRTDEVAELTSVRERAYLIVITSLCAMDRAEEAIEAAKVAVAEVAASTKLHMALADALASIGRDDEGRAVVAHVLAIDPGDLDALAARFWPSDTSDADGFVERIQEVKVHAEAHPDRAGTWRTLARIYLAAGHHDDAVDAFLRAIEVAPDDNDLRSEYWESVWKMFARNPPNAGGQAQDGASGALVPVELSWDHIDVFGLDVFGPHVLAVPMPK